MGAPATLPADFFKDAPDTLPADFFSKQQSEPKSQAASIPGTERTGLPPAAGPKIPGELQSPVEKDTGFLNWKDPGAGLIGQGARQIGRGVAALAQPDKQSKYRGGSDIIGGAGKMLAPVGIGATLPALAAAPVATVAGLAGGTAAGYAGSELAKAGARAINASPEGEQFAGDVAAIPSAIAGGGLAAEAGPAAPSVIGGAARGAWKGATAPSGIHVRGFQAPASVAGAVVGGGLGALSGIPEARAVGTAVGAAVPIVRGMARGAKQGLADYRYSQIPKAGIDVPPVEPQPIPNLTPLSPPSRVLPSGRTVPVPGEQPNPATQALNRAKATVDKRAATPPPLESPQSNGRPVMLQEDGKPLMYTDTADTKPTGTPKPTGNANLSELEQAIIDKRRAAATAKDEALASYAVKNNISEVKPGQSYMDFVKKADAELGTSYAKNSRINDQFHSTRVQELNDLIKKKFGAASASEGPPPLGPPER